MAGDGDQVAVRINRLRDAVDDARAMGDVECPDLVRMDKAEPGFIGDNKPLLDKIFVEGIQSVTANGIVGDPRRATREMGEALLEHLTDVLSGELRERLG